MSQTEWTVESTYMPGEYVVVPDGDLRWIEWSPKYGKADAQLAVTRLNAKRVSPERLLSALGQLERFTPTTTIQVVDQMEEERRP